MPRTNRNEQRAARRLAERQGLTYQQALHLVRRAPRRQPNADVDYLHRCAERERFFSTASEDEARAMLRLNKKLNGDGTLTAVQCGTPLDVLVVLEAQGLVTPHAAESFTGAVDEHTPWTYTPTGSWMMNPELDAPEGQAPTPARARVVYQETGIRWHRTVRSTTQFSGLSKRASQLEKELKSMREQLSNGSDPALERDLTELENAAREARAAANAQYELDAARQMSPYRVRPAAA